MERPLFWVVLLHSASSLSQQQLCGEYLVVGLPLHDRFEVAQGCSHVRSYRIHECLDGGTGEFVGRRHKLRDTPLGLFGVKLIFLVEGLLAEHLVIRFSLLTGPGVFSVVVGHVPPFPSPRSPYATTASVYPLSSSRSGRGSALSSSCTLMVYRTGPEDPTQEGIVRRDTPRIMRGWTTRWRPGQDAAPPRSRESGTPRSYTSWRWSSERWDGEIPRLSTTRRRTSSASRTAASPSPASTPTGIS